MRRSFKIVLALTVVFVILVCLAIPEYNPRGYFAGYPFDVQSPLRQEKTIDIRVDTLPEEKFLVYLPQDTFYQQKIALENAILLAYYLNRSLILPPAYLGNIIEWEPFDVLYPQVTGKSKQSKKYCSNIVLSKLPSECLSYTSWTRLPWSVFFDLSKVKDYVRIYEETDLSFDRLSRYGIAKEDIHVFKEDVKYEYKFSDATVLHNNTKGHFKSLLHFSKFEEFDQKLLYIHSMNGRGRVQTSHPNNYRVFQEMLKTYVWNNRAILNVADTVIDILGGGGNYIGIEVPTLGLEFSEKIPENVEAILTALAEELSDLKCKRPQVEPRANPYSLEKCRLRAQEDSCHSPLLYLSTDSINPRLHMDLAPIFERYPCTFTQQDFHQEFSTLSAQVNEDDQINLAQYIAPMVETEIVARGSFVATIRNSMQGIYASLLHDIYFHKRSKIYRKMDFSG